MASGNGYFGYTSYARPDAAAELTGPNSSAFVGGPYAQSYASENARGGVFVDDTTSYGSRFSSVASYHYQGAYHSYSVHDDYSNYTQHAYGSPAGSGDRYGPALPSGYGNLDVLDLYGSNSITYAGNVAYHDSYSSTVEEFSSGYTLTRTSERSYASAGGQVVPGSQHNYATYTSTDPYGDVTDLPPGQSAPAFYTYDAGYDGSYGGGYGPYEGA